jgi:hypothetical protein
MMIALTLFCVGSAVLLVSLGVYAEFHESRSGNGVGGPSKPVSGHRG